MRSSDRAVQGWKVLTGMTLTGPASLGQRGVPAPSSPRPVPTYSARRLRLLAHACDLLDSPLDVDATVQFAARLATEDLADWCAVDLRPQHGVAHVAVAHRDPRMSAVVQALQDRYPSDRTDPMVAAVLDAGQPMHLAVSDGPGLLSAARDHEHLRLLRALEVGSLAYVPVLARGRDLGLMTLGSCGDRRLTAEDVELAAELGRRVGVAVDNARLYGERDRVARALQRSLLPPRLPRLPGVDLAARYRPATAGSDIGGDFYDVFPTGPQRWAFVIGDVCGKGPDAAALTGALRYTLRAIALSSDDPGAALAGLNDAVHQEDWDDRFATVTLVMAWLPGDGSMRLRIASAGHPPPMVRRADGSVEVLRSEGMLVGPWPEVSIATRKTTLRTGEALVLYTDGVTETRDAGGRFYGEYQLVRTLRAAGDAAAETLAAAVDHDLERFGDGLLRDDVAVVVASVGAG